MALNRGPASLLGLVLLSTSSATYAGPERLAVLVLPATHRESLLADNLTEIAIAHLAERPDRELVGTLELRRHAGNGRNLPSCMQEPACLGEVGSALGVSRVVTGVVRDQGSGFLLSLALTNIGASRVENRFFKEVNGNTRALIAAMEEGIGLLFRPVLVPGRLRVASRPEGARVVLDDLFLGTTPLVSGPISPGGHRLRVELDGHFAWRTAVEVPSGDDLTLDLGNEQLVRRRWWPTPLAYGGAAAAALSFASGALFGAIGSGHWVGQTRMQAQQDLQRRKSYVTAANGLIVSGVALAAVSLFTFWQYRRDIAGD